MNAYKPPPTLLLQRPIFDCHELIRSRNIAVPMLGMTFFSAFQVLDPLFGAR